MSSRRFIGLYVGAVASLFSASAFAAPAAEGIWMDHTGRGAVEIKDCGGKLCGHVVWVKDTTDKKKGCGLQILGDLSAEGTKRYGGGWVYSPEKKRKYDVEITPLSDGTLRVLGYAGSKLFSKTMIWTKPGQDLVLCQNDQQEAAAKPVTGEPAKSEASVPPAPAVAAAAAPSQTAAPAEAAKTAAPDEPSTAAKSDTATASSETKSAATAAGTAEAGKTTDASKVAAADPNAKVKKRFKDEEEEEEEQDDTPVKKEMCKLKVPYVTISIPCPE